MLTDRNLVGPRLGPFSGRHVHLALTALDVAEADAAVDLRDDRRILRTTRLEELRHPRQTAGDVAGLVHLAADLREGVAGSRPLSPSCTVSCAPTGMMNSRSFSLFLVSFRIWIVGWSFFSRSSMIVI